MEIENKEWEKVAGPGLKRHKERQREEYAPYFAYDDDSKGVISDVSQPGRACDVSHLNSILYNLDKIVEFYALDVESCVRESKLKDFYSVLHETETEVARLNQHPYLFPNQAIRKGFMEELWITYCNLDRIDDAYEEFELKIEEFFQAEAHDRENDRLPTRDPLRTHWQNFMAKDAPGAWHRDNFPFHPTPGTGSSQILPIPGVNFITERIEETIDILNELDDHHGRQRIPREDRSQQLGPPQRSFSENVSRKIRQYRDQQAPANTGFHVHDVRGRETQTLEALTQDFSILSQNIAGPVFRGNDMSLLIEDTPDQHD